MKVLVIGFTTEKGQKITEFLISRGAVVSVADNRVGQKVKEIEGISRIFTLNPKHRDSLWLMMEMTKPDALVYCVGNEDYGVFKNALLIAVKNKVSKIVLVTNQATMDDPQTLAEVDGIAMAYALFVVARENNVEYLIIHPPLNLLKEVKKFLLKEEQEGEIL